MTPENIERAIEFVMDFYNISRETALALYRDEIDAMVLVYAMRL